MMLFFRRCAVMDIFDAVFFHIICCYSLAFSILSICTNGSKLCWRATWIGILQMLDKNVNSKGCNFCSPLIFLESFYAFKNSSINFIFLFKFNPLWFLNLFFKSAKWPSIALVVLGILSSINSYQVNNQGKLFFKLR